MNLSLFRLDRLLTLYFFRPLKRILPCPRGIRIPILMYHSISDEPENDHPYHWINTSPKVFTEHMRFLAENNYKVISLSEAVKIISSVASQPIMHGSSQWSNLPSFQYSSIQQKKVVLTFDDGYKDFLTQAFPILKNGYGFPSNKLY